MHSNWSSSFKSTAGPVEIYTGAVAVSNGNTLGGKNDVPTNMRIYHSPSISYTDEFWNSTNFMQVHSSAAVYASIYSPTLNVLMGNYTGGNYPGYVFGAIISKTTAIEYMSQVHYDEALKDAQGWPNWMGGGTGSTTVTLLAQY